MSREFDMNRLEQSNTFDDGRLTIIYVVQLKIIKILPFDLSLKRISF
jgi:hypothetical protein